MNRRYTMAVLSLGGHHAMGQAFAGNMNLPPPVQSYPEHLEVLTEAAKRGAKSELLLKLRKCLAKTLGCHAMAHGKDEGFPAKTE